MSIHGNENIGDALAMEIRETKKKAEGYERAIQLSLLILKEVEDADNAIKIKNIWIIIIIVGFICTTTLSLFMPLVWLSKSDFQKTYQGSNLSNALDSQEVSVAIFFNALVIQFLLRFGYVQENGVTIYSHHMTIAIVAGLLDIVNFIPLIYFLSCTLHHYSFISEFIIFKWWQLSMITNVIFTF